MSSTKSCVLIVVVIAFLGEGAAVVFGFIARSARDDMRAVFAELRELDKKRPEVEATGDLAAQADLAAQENQLNAQGAELFTDWGRASRISSLAFWFTGLLVLVLYLMVGVRILIARRAQLEAKKGATWEKVVREQST